MTDESSQALTSPDGDDERLIYFTNPRDLRVDPEVQRNRRDLKNPDQWDLTVRSIIEDGWDPLQAGAIEVTRMNGFLYVNKGQGRTIAAQVLGVESILAIEMPFTQKAEVADSSLREVMTTRRHDAFDKYRLAVTAGREEDLLMTAIVSSHLLRIERVSGQMSIAIGAARRIYLAHSKTYPQDGQLLERVLCISDALYAPSRNSLARLSDILHAIADLVRLEDGCEWTFTPKEFADRILEKRDLEDWGRKFTANTSHKTAMRKTVATMWREVWNKARHTHKFPPLPWEGDI